MGTASEHAARADALLENGNLVEAIDVLTEANRSSPDADTERRLVRLRHDGFKVLPKAKAAAPSVGAPDRAVDTRTLPVISASELTSERVSMGILGHGALHVRGLVPRERADRLVEGIDRSFCAAEAFESGKDVSETTPWFEPFWPSKDYPREMRNQVGRRRKWVREAGGVWAADSPRMMFELFDALDAVGMTRLVTEYLGERPALPVDKCTLRRVRVDTGSDWHQDGAFLGTESRVINVWLCLSACGRDAPGLDVVPRRLDEIVETGTEGAQFHWSVGPGVVDRVSNETPIVRPEFAPGDAMLFDEMFLHRTAIDPSMTRERYAVETWFFAPSTLPERYVPFVV